MYLRDMGTALNKCLKDNSNPVHISIPNQEWLHRIGGPWDTSGSLRRFARRVDRYRTRVDKRWAGQSALDSSSREDRGAIRSHQCPPNSSTLLGTTHNPRRRSTHALSTRNNLPGISSECRRYNNYLSDIRNALRYLHQ